MLLVNYSVLYGERKNPPSSLTSIFHPSTSFFTYYRNKKKILFTSHIPIFSFPLKKNNSNNSQIISFYNSHSSSPLPPSYLAPPSPNLFILPSFLSCPRCTPPPGPAHQSTFPNKLHPRQNLSDASGNTFKPVFSYILLSIHLHSPDHTFTKARERLERFFSLLRYFTHPHFVYMVCASPSAVQFPSVSTLEKSRKYPPSHPPTILRRNDSFCFIIIIIFFVSSATYRSCAIPGNTRRPPPPPMVVVKTMCLGLFGMPPWNGRLPTVVTEQRL